MRKKFGYRTLLIVFSLIVTVMIYNYCLDFYGVFWREADNIFFTPNSIYVKTKHVVSNKKKYDSYLFGSSRVGNIDVKKIKNGNYYNMFYFCGIPFEWLRSLQIILENDIKIKNIIFAIDEFAYKEIPEERFDKLGARHYPKTIKDKIPFYMSYLFERPNLHDLIFRYEGIARRDIIYDFAETGNYFRPKEEKEIEDEPDRHRKRGRFYHKLERIKENRIDDLLNEIGQIVNICKANNISIQFIINPVHINFYVDLDIKELNTFKKRLAEITDYYDFCMLTPLVNDNYNFDDLFHYRPHVGDLILARLFNYPEVDVPEWFGIEVTKKNVDKYIKKLDEQWKYYNETKIIHTVSQHDLM